MKQVLKSINHRLIQQMAWHPEREKGSVYLTFDDGPEEGITEFVLDTLASSGAKATFFCVGSRVEEFPALFERILAEGHAVANHTYSHCSGWEMPPGRYVEDVNRCREKVDSVLFRPPWGLLPLPGFLMLRRRYKIILWDRNSSDTAPDVDYGRVDRVIRSLRDGDTVLFHFGNKHGWKTRLILPYFLEGLRTRGLVSRAIHTQA